MLQQKQFVHGQATYAGESQACLINQIPPNNAVSSIIMLTSSASFSAAELVLGALPEEASMEVAIAAVALLLLLA